MTRMNQPTSPAPDSRLQQHRQTQIDKPLQWLIGVFLLCLMLIFGLRAYFNNLQNDLVQQGNHERSELAVAEDVVRNIQGIQRDIYRLASSQNMAEYSRGKTSLEVQVNKLSFDLTQLHWDKLNEQTPQILGNTAALVKLLEQRWNAIESQNLKTFYQAERKITQFLVPMPAFFQTFDSTANQLFLQGQQKMRGFEAQLQESIDSLKQIEAALISLVAILGGVAVILFMRRLTAALQAARLAKDDSEHQREQNATMLDTLGDGVYATDMQGCVSFINRAGENILGWTAADLVGQSAHATLHHSYPGGEAYAPEKCPLVAVLQQGSSLEGEEYFVAKDGQFIPISYRANPLYKDGQIIGSLLSFHDISERLESQERIRLQQIALHEARDQALENSRLKSEFLSNMSHEIRTPMNGIIGMTDLLLDTQLDPEQRDFTQTVRDSSQALLVIINDILDFSKIEAGKLEIEITDFSPVPVVEGTVELLASRAREKSITLTSFIDPALPGLLRGDPTRLRQVLLNLLSNGIKFTHQGSVELYALRLETAQGSMLRFEVRDSGIGISPSIQAKLFQSFTQADSSTTRKYGGTGLGLAICKRLVELMGGSIGIDSTEGQGSTFWFTLPLLVSNPADLPDTTQISERNMAPGLRVLVVDDHASDRKIIHRYLSSWGMVNDGASSAEEALKLMRDAAALGKPYDVALIDYVMPGMNGIELVQVLLHEPALRTTRRVLMSAHDQRELFERALSSGFAVCLSKPIRQSQLFDSLNEQADKQLGVTAQVSSPTSATTSPNPDNSLDNRRLILLAEDNLINQKVAQLQINKLGYALHVVGNGQEAVQAIQADQTSGLKRYAAVLMDCQMPVLDGFEASSLIRSNEQETGQHIPIIAMTANAMQGDRERCLAVGMDDYLSKPIQPEQLSRLLTQWAGSPLLVSTSNLNRSPSTVNTQEQAATAAISEHTQTGVDIDFPLLDDYFDADQEAITHLLKLFVSTTNTIMEKLHSAVTQQASSAVYALAHELKGSCGNIGIERMSHIAGALESASMANDWPLSEALNGDLKQAFSVVVALIEQR